VCERTKRNIRKWMLWTYNIVCTHAYVHIHTHMHTKTHTHMHQNVVDTHYMLWTYSVLTHVCTHTHARAHTHMHTHTHAHAHEDHAHEDTHTDVPRCCQHTLYVVDMECAHTYMHTHTRTCTRRHTRTCTEILSTHIICCAHIVWCVLCAGYM